MTAAIAIVGLACRYPDADSPAELWENVLARRRAFRRIPPERLRLEDYYSDNPAASDHIYITQAALLKNYEFDRAAYHVAGSTYRSADMTHWLALDVATQALVDAGFPDGEGLNRETTGVILGNTLTGEFSRANQMRLRWPYVRRTLEAALLEQGWPAEQRREFLLNLEAQYKAPFPVLDEESLAGGLSNTIAGRICNYFDLKGGGYTVDGACASSLLAMTTACAALTTGDLDLALAGGVDLSLDPFELVGFARTAALAPDTMRVYDKRSAGFWPGEGCGFVVLMRHEDALAQNRRIYALIRGWGISSDGSGGITRPEMEGQILAVRRAYQRAGFGIETVNYFEGHGTGTAVGDATELRTLSTARRAADLNAPPAVIGSVKANIGHTKAAAGVAGIIKTALALHSRIIPPNTGSTEPHPELSGDRPALQLLPTGQCWPADQPARAGVSAMGFGGINTHLVLEGVAAGRCYKTPDGRDQRLMSSPQDAELFLLSGRDTAELQRQIEHLLTFAARLSLAELTDLAVQMQRTVSRGPSRAAIVATTPAELVQRLTTLLGWLADGVTTQLDVRAGLFFGTGARARRIGFLFPGQGTPTYLTGGALAHRFDFIAALYDRAALPQNQVDGVATAVAQPAIVTASLAGLQLLNRLGIEAELAVGHSLGEITALHWAGAMDEASLLRIATVRGQAMMNLGHPTGAMASLRANHETVEAMLNGEAVSIACLNAPQQTVISGPADEVATVLARAKTQGVEARHLAVSHAFHSPLVAAAAKPLADHLAGEKLRSVQRPVISTVTGAPLNPDTDLRHLLYRQVTEPVRFTEAVAQALAAVDVWIEVGPGRVLSSLVSEFVNDIPLVALDAGGSSLKGVMQAAGVAFALGTPLNHEVLFADRFSRPFDLNWQAHFLVNPCELAPIPPTDNSDTWIVPVLPVETSSIPAASDPAESAESGDTLSLVRRLVADRLELPLAAVSNDARLLSDLHLNSITVSQIVAEAARQLQLPVPVSPTDFANVTILEMVQALEEIAQSDGLLIEDKVPPGVDSWVRTFNLDWVERPRPNRQIATGSGPWQVISPPDHPLAETLLPAFATAAGSGVAVCLPPQPDERHLPLLLTGVQAALAMPNSPRFVLVQHGGGGAAFARTFHTEMPHLPICVVDVPLDQPEAATWATSEALAAVSGYTEVRYDAAGRRWEPVFRPLLLPVEGGELPLGPADVLLVTGGGKGITAECAFSLARETGVRLALLGRSQPESDPELAANLDTLRVAAAGLQFRYLSVDVTDPAAVQAAVRDIETSLGPVSAVLHGAARNVPQLLRNLDEETFNRTLAPKVQGARNLLAAIKPGQLRLFVSFGSIIARIGLPGEADYGLANEWLADLTAAIQTTQPACRCLTIDWSVWGGAGMGERLGTLDGLMRQGIMPIPLDEGVKMLHRLLRQIEALPPSVIVTGRFGTPTTIRVEQPEVPFRRFLEQVRVHYPGIELVVEATLSGESDPYLADHVFQGERLFLAVLGLEAMAQTAMALAQTDETPIFEKVQLTRPIVVPEGATTTIRLAALRRETGEIEVALRSAETAFQVDHFRAICRFDRPVETPPPVTLAPWPALHLDPTQELYGQHFFHTGRFRRVQGYRQVTARTMLAELSPSDKAAWFSRYLPPHLALGDPGARDATIHAVQACVPHLTLLPLSVERIVPGVARDSGPRYVQAVERTAAADGDILTFDVIVTAADGTVQEQWQGLRLKMMAGTRFRGAWSPPLLGPYLERRLRGIAPGTAVTAVVTRNLEADERQARSDLAIQRAVGEPVVVSRRADGKPGVAGGRTVSVAHAGELTLAVAAPQAQGPLGCDLETVTVRPETVWQDLLGERFALVPVVAQAAQEAVAIAATRVWAAAESLKKAGAALAEPLTLASAAEEGWVLFETGSLVVATVVVQVQFRAEPLVLAVVMRRNDGS